MWGGVVVREEGLRAREKRETVAEVGGLIVLAEAGAMGRASVRVGMVMSLVGAEGVVVVRRGVMGELLGFDIFGDGRMSSRVSKKPVGCGRSSVES